MPDLGQVGPMPAKEAAFLSSATASSLHCTAITVGAPFRSAISKLAPFFFLFAQAMKNNCQNKEKPDLYLALKSKK